MEQYSKLTELQMSALMPFLTPFVDMVADRIVGRLLPAMESVHVIVCSGQARRMI